MIKSKVFNQTIYQTASFLINCEVVFTIFFLAKLFPNHSQTIVANGR